MRRDVQHARRVDALERWPWSRAPGEQRRLGKQRLDCARLRRGRRERREVHRRQIARPAMPRCGAVGRRLPSACRTRAAASPGRRRLAEQRIGEDHRRAAARARHLHPQQIAAARQIARSRSARSGSGRCSSTSASNGTRFSSPSGEMSRRVASPNAARSGAHHPLVDGAGALPRRRSRRGSRRACRSASIASSIGSRGTEVESARRDRAWRHDVSGIVRRAVRFGVAFGPRIERAEDRELQQRRVLRHRRLHRLERDRLHLARETRRCARSARLRAAPSAPQAA